jgi:hypothetical protein
MSVLRLVPVIGEDVVVDQDRALVGREPTCDVIIEHGSVSRKHAVLERRADGWYVVDQGSANGTYIDSAKVGESALRHGQELRFGAAAYRVDLPPDEDEVGATVITAMPEADATVLTPAAAVRPPVLPRPAVPPRPAGPPAAPPAMPPPIPPRAAAPPPPPPPPRPGIAPPPVPGMGAPVPQMAAPPAAPRKGKGPVFWIATGCGGCLVMVLLLFGLFAGGLFYMTSGATDAVRAQLEEIKAGKLEEAHARFSESYRAEIPSAAFAAFVDRHPSVKDNADSTFTSRNVTNNRAQLKGTLKAGSGVTEEVDYRLVKEGGDWKVEFMEVAGDRPDAGEMAQLAGVSGGGNLSLRADVGKTTQPDQVRVQIRAEVAGFGVRPDAGAFVYDLAEDVATTGPDGQAVAELTQADVHRHQGRTSLPQGAVYPFERVLTLDPALTPGTYVVRLTIRDLVGGGSSSREVRFDMP